MLAHVVVAVVVVVVVVVAEIVPVVVVIVVVAVLFVGIACCIGAEAHVVVGDKKMTRVALIVDAMIDFLYLDDIAKVTVTVVLKEH